MQDKSGRAYAKLSEINVGDTVEIDEGFDCMEPGPKVVYKDEDGFYVLCFGPEHENQAAATCHHYLDGQIDDDADEILIGIYPISK